METVKLGSLQFGDKFAMDTEDAANPAEHLKFLSFAYDGAAMIAAANTDFVRGFKTGLDKNTEVIKL